MQLADVVNFRRFLIEIADGVAAQQREAVHGCQLVPHHFKPDRGIGLPAAPQHIDHFSVGAERRSDTAANRLLHQAANLTLEQKLVGGAVVHERAERFLGVEHDEVAEMAGSRDVDEMRAQCILDGGSMIRSRNDNRRLAGDESFAEEGADGLEELGFVAVELNGMMMGVNAIRRPAFIHERENNTLRPSQAVRSRGELRLSLPFPLQNRATHQYLRITPTTTPCTWTRSGSTMIGCIVGLAGWSRTLPFSR